MTIDFRGTPIHVELEGKGRAVVLLHGFLEGGYIWKNFIPELCSSSQVVNIDLFGHGQTPKFAETHDMTTMAEAVAVVLENLGIDKASFIGHSMGGYVALAFLEAYPGKVDRILLLNSSTIADTEERKKERDQVISISRKYKRTFVKMAVTNLFAKDSRKQFKESLQILVEEANKMSSEAIGATVRGLKNRSDRTNSLAQFNGKKWIIAGNEDKLIPLKSILKVSEDTGAKLYTMPGGHMSYIEEGETVLRLLKEFLKED